MKKTWVAAAIVLVLLPLGLARAAEFASNSNGDIIVPATESHRNFYTAGESVTVDSATQGDLAVAGQTVIVNGNVEKSLFAAGDRVNIRGNVGDHARLAGSRITISGNINGDVFAVGQIVTISKDTVISGGLYAAGSTIIVNGTVKGEVRSAASELIINGHTGSVNAYGDVTVNKTAVIAGDLRNKSNHQATVADGATITGATHFTEVKRSANGLAVFLTFAAVVSLLGWIILGLLVILLLAKQAQKALDRAFASPAGAAGYGFAVLLFVPITAIILAITLIGLPIALVLGLAWLLVVIIGSLVGKIALGAVIYKLFAKDKPYIASWLTLGIGIIASALVGFIPVIGDLVKFIFLLIGIGALTQIIFGWVRPTKTADASNPQ